MSVMQRSDSLAFRHVKLQSLRDIEFHIRAQIGDQYGVGSTLYMVLKEAFHGGPTVVRLRRYRHRNVFRCHEFNTYRRRYNGNISNTGLLQPKNSSFENGLAEKFD